MKFNSLSQYPQFKIFSWQLCRHESRLGAKAGMQAGTKAGTKAGAQAARELPKIILYKDNLKKRKRKRVIAKYSIRKKMFTYCHIIGLFKKKNFMA